MVAGEPGGQKAWDFIRDKLIRCSVLNDDPRWAILARPSEPIAVERPGPLTSLVPLQISPNPCASTCRVHFTLTKTGFVHLALYTSAGQLVRALFSGKRDAGTLAVNVPVRNLANGVYICRLEQNNRSQIQKLVIIR